MPSYKITFTAKFEGWIDADDEEEATMEVDIPESGSSKYVNNSMDIVSVVRSAMALDQKLSFDPHATIRERLVCLTPELSERIFALRASFQDKINRTPAGLWPIKTGLETILWKRARAEWAGEE